jgi:hypothetical protein
LKKTLYMFTFSDGIKYGIFKHDQERETKLFTVFT